FWIRATLPRVRVDRLMSFAWKTMVPLAIANIFLSAIWFEIVVRPAGGLQERIIGWVVTGPLTVLTVWFVFRLNRNSYKSNDPDRRPTLISRTGVSLLATSNQGG
ncbi:MAG: NADH-quinone oxidoreductase subunit H, partial [Planctomycetota bacterium]